ncbi:hypothetical protein ANN_20854 [Periplaneta americana]|uniref:Uncharacterized protein n=1 Tax=Periplaneta americana TaxID=6978 RepID=A0ABQ8SDS8_PERAM|nr:hypothetical protein ANN_20854 [Periplaneta americana]
MAGLCEGGNEPPGSLKAKEKMKLEIPLQETSQVATNEIASTSHKWPSGCRTVPDLSDTTPNTGESAAAHLADSDAPRETICILDLNPR